LQNLKKLHHKERIQDRGFGFALKPTHATKAQGTERKAHGQLLSTLRAGPFSLIPQSAIQNPQSDDRFTKH
jgi:hypothetical protein